MAEARPYKSMLMDADEMRRVLDRIAYELLEQHRGAQDLVLVGIRRRGVPLAQRLAERLAQLEGVRVPVGVLDITLYRDDLSERTALPQVQKSEVPFAIKGKRLILVDDVLYTGRTVRAALDACLDLGRPQVVELVVLVDRGHRELPIRADYTGKHVPTAKRERVEVQVAEVDGLDAVILMDSAP